MSYKPQPQRPKPQKATRMVRLAIVVSFEDAVFVSEYLGGATSAELGIGMLACHRVADALKTAIYMQKQKSTP